MDELQLKMIISFLLDWFVPNIILQDDTGPRN